MIRAMINEPVRLRSLAKEATMNGHSRHKPRPMPANRQRPVTATVVQRATNGLNRSLFGILVLLLLTAALVLPMASHAQVPVDEDGNPIPTKDVTDSASSDYAGTSQADATKIDATTPLLSDAELETLVGPVALYPDDLLAIVLPASTYPLEIVQAARFLDDRERDSALEPDENWDESVVALLNYPDVLRMMNDDIDWTWKLGDAVIGQQASVIAAVESFRDRAYAAGNLKSDDRQVVNVDKEKGTILIEPVDEEIIYVPYYEPEKVVVYQPRPVYHYYPDPYPVYYYPYPVGYRFHRGHFWGVTTAFSIGWSNHYLHVYHPTYWGHPYYGRSYYGHYYRRPSISIFNNWYVNNSYRSARYRYRDGDYWRPRYRSAGSRQHEPRVRNYHYPPNRTNGSNASVNIRGDARATNRRDTSARRAASADRRDPRDSVRTRSNGRMDLNLRERNTAGSTVRRPATAGNRSATRDVPVRENNRRSNAVRSGDTVNRARTSSGERRNTTRSTAQRSSERADIQFRSRNSDRDIERSTSRNVVQPRVANRNSVERRQPTIRRSAGDKRTQPTERRVPAVNQRRSTNSAAAPSVQPRQRTTVQRAPVQRAPARRQAPQRSQARSAPRQAAPMSAPKARSSGGQSRSAPAGRSGAGDRPRSRPRNK